MQKIVRSICLFADGIDENLIKGINELSSVLEDNRFIVQTKRICLKQKDIKRLKDFTKNNDILLGLGSLSLENFEKQFKDFCSSEKISVNIDLSDEDIKKEHSNMIFNIIRSNARQTFNFAYVFNNKNSSPFFPSASYEKDGFAIGLQLTNLSQNCRTLEEWFEKMENVWNEIFDLFKNNSDFLGIDSSVAPLFEEEGSLIYFIKNLGKDFSDSVLTDSYLKITSFIKNNNPKPVGLCGLMFPCLEDFELAREYEKGNFSIERNIFLSLHSGLGIDTYPVGIDEDPEKILNILKLIQGLSIKYDKPLSVRFVSDGKTKIGEKTDFKNPYLKDVIIKRL